MRTARYYSYRRSALVNVVSCTSVSPLKHRDLIRCMRFVGFLDRQVHELQKRSIGDCWYTDIAPRP